MQVATIALGKTLVWQGTVTVQAAAILVEMMASMETLEKERELRITRETDALMAAVAEEEAKLAETEAAEAALAEVAAAQAAAEPKKKAGKKRGRSRKTV